jgi:uncharacterized secreted protein with C-terminal beta-propeller domain
MSFSKAIPEDDSGLQVPLSEAEKTPGYVKNKIKSQNRPSRGSRARKEIRGSLAKIIKKAASITDLFTEHDQQENLRVIRQAKQATHRIYDGEQKRLIEVPDHKTRLAATMLDLAYREGKPVERSITAHADMDDFEKMIEIAKQVQDQQSLQKTVQR